MLGNSALFLEKNTEE